MTGRTGRLNADVRGIHRSTLEVGHVLLLGVSLFPFRLGLHLHLSGNISML